MKLCIFLFLAAALPAQAADWSENAPSPAHGEVNPYHLSAEAFQQAVTQGRIHAQMYPVTVTGMLPPLVPLQRLLEADPGNPLKRLIQSTFRAFSGFRQINDVLRWVGMHPYPQVGDTGVYAVPYPDGTRPDHLLGFGVIQHPLGTGFSLSCATCHSSNLFGKTVLGLTNRFPRANEVFTYAKMGFALMPPKFFQANTGSTDGETQLFARTRENLHRVGTKRPVALGLDTSLAQVALSLALRSADAFATPSAWYEKFPRSEPLREKVADSKPAVWWNVKYKNRWLSDGAVVSGNPVLTNILWNEIGRGGDLHELDQWMHENDAAIQSLTTAVFASEAPRFTDFFLPEKIPLAEAKAGQKIFEARCARCHGQYEKGWDAPDAASRSATDLLATLRVTYHEQTPVMNVGTDAGRWEGMKSLEQLNGLDISRHNGIVFKPQAGYVPPPLVGIWARWPYFHNNAVPSLCAVLTKATSRPVVFYTGEANDPAKDFDQDCNGYPLDAATPDAWTQDPAHRFDTREEGMHNSGHDEGIFLSNGQELLSPVDKKNLIRFLQTL